MKKQVSKNQPTNQLHQPYQLTTGIPASEETTSWIQGDEFI